MTAAEIIAKLDELLHDPRTNSVEFYVKVLRLWEKLEKCQQTEAIQ
jgi:hypothetical protein